MPSEYRVRPSWDEVWMQVAQTMARRSRCDRAQVGAVVVSADNRVLSTGYNGTPRGFDLSLPEYLQGSSCSHWCPRAQEWRGESLDPVYDDCHAAHAEANALTRADFTQMEGATLYVSTSMCKGCAKMFANSGVTRVVFGYAGDGSDAYRSPDKTENFLVDCGVEVTRWTEGPTK